MSRAAGPPQEPKADPAKPSDYSVVPAAGATNADGSILGANGRSATWESKPGRTAAALIQVAPGAAETI